MPERSSSATWFSRKFRVVIFACLAVAWPATAPATTDSPEFHSADSDTNGCIDPAEITRLLVLYNTKHGTERTGCYQVATDTPDGFAPDPTRPADAIVSLSRYHSADFNHDGKLSLAELTRAIQLYSYHSSTVRTGIYHAQVGTEDGFAPGLNYKGSLAGNAVPTSSTRTGDYYLVTSAGTSQAKTWAPGNFAVWTGTDWQQIAYTGADTSGPALAALANAPALTPAKSSNLQNASRKVFRVFYGGTSIENMAWSWGSHLRESLMRQYGDSGNRTLYTQAFGGTPGQSLGWYKQRYGGLTFYRLRGRAGNMQGQGSTTPIQPLFFSGNVREIVVHYSTEPDGGLMNVLVDGSAPAAGATINCAGPQSYNQKVVYSFATAGVHTISISCPTDPTKFGYFETIDMNLNNPGIAWVDSSLGGSSIIQLCNPQPTGPWGGTWSSGVAYSAGIYAGDPVDGHCYQARTNITGGTPPRNDSVNWLQTGEDPPSPQSSPLAGVESYILDADPIDRFDLVIWAWVVNDAGNGPANFSTYYTPALAEVVARTRANGQQLMLVAEMGGPYLVSNAGGVDPVYTSIVSLLKNYASEPHVTFIDWNAATQPPATTVLSDWQAYADRYYNSHALLRGPAAAGATSLIIDDASSLGPGTTATLDTGTNQETVVAGRSFFNVVTSGTWTIPLSSPLSKAHASGATLTWNAPTPVVINAVSPTLSYSGNFIHPAPAGHAVAYALICSALNVPSDGSVGAGLNDGEPRLLQNNALLVSVASPPEAPGQPANTTKLRVVDNAGQLDPAIRSIGQSNYGYHDLSGTLPYQQALWYSEAEPNLLPYYNEQIQVSTSADQFGPYIDVSNGGYSTAPFANLDGKLVTWTLIVGTGSFYWDVSDGQNQHLLHTYLQGRDMGPQSYWGTNSTDRPIVVHCTTKWEGSSSRISFRGMPHLYGLYVTATNYPCITAAAYTSWSLGAPSWLTNDIPLTQANSGQPYFEKAYDRNGMAITIAKTCVGGRVRKPDGSLHALFNLKDPGYVYTLDLNAATVSASLDTIMGGSAQVPGAGAVLARGPQWPPWNSGGNYTRGAAVTSGAGAYTARNTVVNSVLNPDADTANWAAEPNNGIFAVPGSRWTILVRIKGSDSRAQISHLAWIPTAGGNGVRYWNNAQQTWDSTESAATAFGCDVSREENIAVTVTMAAGMGVGQFELRFDFASGLSAITLAPGSTAGF